jgi:hypothetical protein
MVLRYSAMMTHAEIVARMENGFPLTIHVADGRTFEIPHRDFCWLPPRSSVVMVAVPSPENPEETISHWIPLLMVSGISQKLTA